MFLRRFWNDAFYESNQNSNSSQRPSTSALRDFIVIADEGENADEKKGTDTDNQTTPRSDTGSILLPPPPPISRPPPLQIANDGVEFHRHPRIPSKKHQRGKKCVSPVRIKKPTDQYDQYEEGYGFREMETAGTLRNQIQSDTDRCSTISPPAKTPPSVPVSGDTGIQVIDNRKVPQYVTFKDEADEDAVNVYFKDAKKGNQTLKEKMRNSEHDSDFF